MTFTATLTTAQANAICNFIAKNCADASTAQRNKQAITSTRATFIFDKKTRVAELYSNYTHFRVINEIPERYRTLFA